MQPVNPQSSIFFLSRGRSPRSQDCKPGRTLALLTERSGYVSVTAQRSAPDSSEAARRPVMAHPVLESLHGRASERQMEK